MKLSDLQPGDGFRSGDEDSLVLVRLTSPSPMPGTYPGWQQNTTDSFLDRRAASATVFDTSTGDASIDFHPDLEVQAAIVRPYRPADVADLVALLTAAATGLWQHLPVGGLNEDIRALVGTTPDTWQAAAETIALCQDPFEAEPVPPPPPQPLAVAEDEDLASALADDQRQEPEGDVL